jgi:hypothetical protein
MRIYRSLLILLIFFLASCKPKTGGKNNIEREIHSQSVISVTFISIGEGSDIETLKSFEKSSQTWLEKYSKLKLTKTPWGREGEMDYCFDLSHMNQEHIKTLISEIESVIGQNPLVQRDFGSDCPDRGH